MAKKAATPAPAQGGDFRKKLASANKLWAGAKKRAKEAGTGQASEFADGKYLARCMGGEIAESSGGNLQAIFNWKFEEEPYEGKIKKNYQGLMSEDNLFYLARDIERLGYEAPDDLAGVEAVLAALGKEKPLARIRLKTKENSDFQNLYIDKVIADADDEDGDENAEEEEAEEAEETDDAEEAEEETEEAEEAEEEEEVEEDEDTAEAEVGMKVEVELKAGKQTGVITEILEAEGKVKVKAKDGKIYKVAVDKIDLMTPEEPETPPAKPAGKKKAAKK